MIDGVECIEELAAIFRIFLEGFKYLFRVYVGAKLLSTMLSLYTFPKKYPQCDHSRLDHVKTLQPVYELRIVPDPV